MQANKNAVVSTPRCGICGAMVPLPSRTVPLRRPTRLTVRAAESEKVEMKNYPEVPSLPWSEDEESIEDVMKFTGPAPERVNGRLAMMAFFAGVVAERVGHKSIVEQAGQAVGPVILFMALISFASIIPKYSSGSSLKDLLETASRDGLPANLRFFNKTHEVWTGRVAMLGFLGLVGVELFLGRGLFV
ncbi:hypothetical protein WJX84_009429 [Apatococcus fuscideae]|uniref:Uncharacterized protein n=1 Tax=Apatococcus fuscideae TaxID=2026836 RepID=A0AAW1T086_9CHLO